MSEYSKTLIWQLKPIMASIHEAVRTRFGSTGKEAQAAFQTWQSHFLYPPNNPQDEFCLQSAYMQFAHLYFLRISEEYGLLSPFPADELESKTWLARSLETVQRILNNHAQATFAIFAYCFDWFIPDEQSMLQLYHLLKLHKFKALNADILGNVYNEGFIEQHNRSATGQFYTPPQIVDYMLDTLGIPSIEDDSDNSDYGYTKYHEYIYKTVADLACGSGSFLAAAAARKQVILQRLIARREIDRDDALRILTSTIVGFDINPFACYLATINLLLQSLPLLFNRYSDKTCRNKEWDSSRSPLRFSIYCTDALDPHTMEQVGFDLREFDYLVGNPPYVSAHESSSHLPYRQKIVSSGHYYLLNQKWDLFVPFFERNLQLMRPESGRLGLIVSSGIETEGYAERLRQTLCEHYSLLQIDFFPGLRLFQHIGIESTVVFVENHPPGDAHVVNRRRHLHANLAAYETLPAARQPTGTERVFRWRYLPTLAAGITNGSMPLCAIAYIGTGIEAQSSEYSDQIIDGQRHKRFTLSDVFVLPTGVNQHPGGYANDGVVGDDVDYYYLRRKRFVAYERYQPYMRGPRHVALFRAPEKLLLGETSGGYYDTDGLFANHSVQLVVPWHVLELTGVLQETGIQRVLRKSQHISGTTDLPRIAEQFDLRYVLAIINSRFMRNYIAANMHEGTRKGRIYPDVWKRLPIKVVSLEQQREIAQLVEAVQDEYKILARSGEMDNVDGFAKVNQLVDEIEMLVEETYGRP
ncbi:MAG TPA: N-6 DNA methylase [Ktedonobacteraceae bacterium]|nr:N-6 DNA methylase [Ktedonobacteraceae bacterium]